MSDIEYFFGQQGVDEYIEREKLDINEEMSTYTADFFTEELFTFAIGLTPGPGDSVLNLLLTGGEFADGYRENEQLLKVKTIQQTASLLSLELQMNSHRDGNNEQIQLIPSKETFRILDRWKAVHQVDNNYPYPETAIEQQDWVAINLFLRGDGEENKGEIGKMKYSEENKIDDEVFDYIISNSVDEANPHPIVNDALNQN